MDPFPRSFLLVELTPVLRLPGLVGLHVWLLHTQESDMWTSTTCKRRSMLWNLIRRSMASSSAPTYKHEQRKCLDVNWNVYCSFDCRVVLYMSFYSCACIYSHAFVQWRKILYLVKRMERLNSLIIAKQNLLCVVIINFCVFLWRYDVFLTLLFQVPKLKTLWIRSIKNHMAKSLEDIYVFIIGLFYHSTLRRSLKA